MNEDNLINTDESIDGLEGGKYFVAHEKCLGDPTSVSGSPKSKEIDVIFTYKDGEEILDDDGESIKIVADGSLEKYFCLNFRAGSHPVHELSKENLERIRNVTFINKCATQACIENKKIRENIATGNVKVKSKTLIDGKLK